MSKVSFVHQAAEPETTEQVEDNIDLSTINLPTKLYQQLKAAAQDYEVAKLENMIKELEKLGQQEKVFAARLWQYLNRYDIDGLQDELDKITCD